MTELDISNEIILRLGLPYKEANSYKIHCVSHNDKRPSMSITKLVKDQFPGNMHCWSCGFHSTLKSYYYEKTGHSIYQDLGIKREATQNTIHEQVDFSIPPKVEFRFEGKYVRADHTINGLKWAKSRGFDSSIIQKFDIRYSDYCLTKSKDDPNNKTKWTYFFNRVLIPIYENNNSLSIEARDTEGENIYKDTLRRKNLSIDDFPYKKVLYPKGSSTNTLYRLNSLDTTKPLFLVEGIMDVIALNHCNLFENSTAIFKNIPTERQFFLLSKFPEIICIPNNDAPSYTGFKKIWEKFGNKVEILPVPSAVNDVNDILQGKHPNIKTIKSLVDNGWLKKIIKPDETFFNSKIELLVEN